MNLFSASCVLTGITSLLFGVFVAAKNPKSALNVLWCLVSVSVALWSIGLGLMTNASEYSVAVFWLRVHYMGAILIPTFFLHFVVKFINRKKSLMLVGVYGLAAVLMIASFAGGLADTAPKRPFNFYTKDQSFYPAFVLFFLCVVIYAHYLLIKAYRQASDAQRGQVKYLFIGSGIGFAGGSTAFFPVFNWPVFPYGMYLVALYTAIVGYSIVRYRLMDITTVIHKTAMWAAMSSIVIIPAGSFFYLNHAWVSHLSSSQMSLLVSTVVLLLIPYIKVVQPRIDHLFQRRKHDLRKILQDFIHEIAVLKSLDELVKKLQDIISSVLYPENTSIVLFDVKSGIIKPFQVTGLADTLAVERHTEFLKWLERVNTVAELDLIEADPHYADVKDNAKQYFEDIKGKVVVPLTHDRKLVGVINLGQKRNLKSYSILDLEFLSNLKIEASIAFSNALLYDDVNKMSLELKQWATELERKVEERTRELAESKQEVEKAYTKLKDLDAIKTKFFANVSHELRTPLTLIMAPLESMLKGEMGLLQKSQEGHIQIMYQNSLRLLKMINNLLDLAKIDAGKMQLTLDRVNLTEFIKGIVASVSPMADKKQIRLSFNDGHSVSEMVCDKEKVERVLLNLIFNSLKFTDPGGSVTVQCGKARPEDGNGQGDGVLISVTDTGIGFPKEFQTKIFERFSQVDASASRKYEGSGIGLSLAKELVELHGGRIWAESEPGKGTVMTFILPMNLAIPEPEGTAEERRAARRRAQDRRAGERRREEDWTRALHTAAEYSAADIMKEAVAAQVPATVSASPPEHTILLIEDNADMRSFIAFQLQEEFELFQARDGIEGVELAARHLPSLIISDVMMPGKDGYQVCREIKSNPHTQHIPVILLTAKADMSEKISGLEYGADDYLTKPFNGQELKAKIRSLIQLRRLEREIQHRSEELEQTLKRLGETQSQLVHSEKMAALGLLVAGVAHEVNNPVSFAKGSLSNLRRYLLQVRQALEKNPETREVLVQFNKLLQDIEQSLNIVKSGLDRTEGIVIDLKAFARKDEQNFKQVDIHEGLEATIKLIQHEMRDRITLHRDYGIRDAVEIIPGQINQVFMNLLQNAIHAVPEKGDIWLRSWEDGDQVHLSVRDSGTGIRKEILGRIFEPFFTTKEVGRGTGLGLSVSYRIIENHGGKITASSEEGHGAEFVITLPKRRTPEPPAPRASAEPISVKGVSR